MTRLSAGLSIPEGTFPRLHRPCDSPRCRVVGPWGNYIFPGYTAHVTRLGAGSSVPEGTTFSPVTPTTNTHTKHRNTPGHRTMAQHLLRKKNQSTSKNHFCSQANSTRIWAETRSNTWYYTCLPCKVFTKLRKRNQPDWKPSHSLPKIYVTTITWCNSLPWKPPTNHNKQ